MRRIIPPAVILLIFMLPVAARPQQQDAQVTVEAHVNNVLKVLRNPALKGERGEKEKRAEITAEAGKLFDFVELSKRTLGLDWNRFSLDQRRELVNVYKNILQDTYVDRITSYTNEKVEFTNTVPLDRNTAEVRSEVIRQDGRIPIYYRAMNENGQWKVYDVVIEGVSLISNYRSQFREILINHSPQELLDTLKKKVGSKS
jgi:phospholipid transport system substrate-binding protein